MKFTLCVYDVSQCYGGPEEGGWWFDAGELMHSKAFNRAPTKKEIKKFIKNVARMNRSEERTPRHSVASTGEYVFMVYEGRSGAWNPPPFFPQRRPMYS